MRVRVQGGTDAGRKQPMKPRPTEAWKCLCHDANMPLTLSEARAISKLRDSQDRPLLTFKSNPPYLVRCPDCGQSRDPAADSA